MKALVTHMVEHRASLPVHEIRPALAIALCDLHAALQKPPEAQLEEKARAWRWQSLHTPGCLG